MTSPGSTVSRARSAVLAVSLWRDVWSAAEADCPEVRAVGGRARRRGVLGMETPRKTRAARIGRSGGITVLFRLSAEFRDRAISLGCFRRPALLVRACGR